MSNNIFKQAALTAKEAAIKSARQIVREPLEILKETGIKTSAQPETQKPEMSMMQQVMTGDGKISQLSPQAEQSIHQATKSRLQQIEAELRQLRMQREQRSQDWIKQQNELMKVNKQTEPPKTYVEAPGKPKRGPKGPGQKKGGTQEIGKQYKG